MRTFYVEIVNTTDRRDNESRKVLASNKEEAIEKTRREIRNNFCVGRCVAARGEDKRLVREFRSYCGGEIR